MNNPDRFLICLPFTLTQEGGYSNDPHDSGGRTMEGVVQREYDAYRKHNKLHLQSVKLISDAEMHDIYLNNYWLPHCPNLPPGVDLSFFDQAVNEGPFEAIVLLQRTLNITRDGDFGPKTLAAVQSISPAVLIRFYSSARADFYRSLGTFKYFGKDWIRRTDEIEAESLKMVVSLTS